MQTRPVLRKEWLLLLVAAPWEPESPAPLDRVRVQKALFVLGESDTELHRSYTFTPYHYGPFCKDVYSDAEQLIHEGLLEEVSHHNYKAYQATSMGRVAARDVQLQVQPKTAEYVKSARAWVEANTFSSLVRAIYERWPAMKSRSIFNG